MTWPTAIAEGWHPIAEIEEIGGQRPLARKLMGQSLVLFRSGEIVSVLRDRCPHRGAPLSRGRVSAGAIVCPYHGWRFSGDGRCLEVPGAMTCPDAAVQKLPVRLTAGLVWTSLSAAPAEFPRLPEAMMNPDLDRFWWRLAPSEAGLLDALENHLDPAHPHFIHPWLVRSPSRRRELSVRVRTGPWGAEAEYLEMRHNPALLSAAFEGKRARSIGRLWPPSTGEVRLESACGAMLSIAVIFAPVDVGLTRPWAHFASTRGWLPRWAKRVALKAFHWPILQQDRRILRLQQRNRGESDYAIGPLDVLARAIWRHANYQPCPEDEARLQMRL